MCVSQAWLVPNTPFLCYTRFHKPIKTLKKKSELLRCHFQRLRWFMERCIIQKLVLIKTVYSGKNFGNHHPNLTFFGLELGNNLKIFSVVITFNTKTEDETNCEWTIHPKFPQDCASEEKSLSKFISAIF